jgi:hypothetical protein
VLGELGYDDGGESVSTTFKGQCTGGTGPDLARWRHLAYNAEQWGDHIVCHSNGAPVAEVVLACQGAEPQATSLGGVAGRFGVSVAEVLDCLAYDAHRARHASGRAEG